MYIQISENPVFSARYQNGLWNLLRPNVFLDQIFPAIMILSMQILIHAVLPANCQLAIAPSTHLIVRFACLYHTKAHI